MTALIADGGVVMRFVNQECPLHGKSLSHEKESKLSEPYKI